MLSNIEKINIQRIAVYLYTVSGMTPEKIDQIMETISPEAKDAFDEFRIKIFEEGREEGREEGIEKIILNMIIKGYTDKQITEITNLSISRIQVLRKKCSE